MPTTPLQSARKLPTDLASRLEGILGQGYVLTDPESLQRYVEAGEDTSGLVVVQPGRTEDVQEIVRAARDSAVPIWTLNDGTLPRRAEAAGPPREGIVLDFCRMRRIEKLDKRNLLAHVQRGLTFPELQSALEPEGLKIAAPLAATSESVLCNFVNRNPLKKATLYPEVHVFTMQVVLADGRLLRTGSHALSEESADLREDGGPSLSRWFFGSEDIFGVITRATVWLYPQTECRDALLCGFEDLAGLAAALRNGPRTELGWEYIGVNKRFLSRLLGDPLGAGIPEWILIVGFDGRKRLVAYQKERISGILTSMGGRRIGEHEQRVAPLLDEVWYRASPFHIGFYTLPYRLVEFDTLIRSSLGRASTGPDSLTACFLAIDRARSIYAAYDVLIEAGDARSTVPVRDEIEAALASAGAFFDRPREGLCDRIFDQVPNLRAHVRTVKGVMDPGFLFNPGRYVREADPVFEPLEVAFKTEADTGIEEENISQVEAALAAVVGAEWVSQNRADLSAYGRDFTIFSGERPNIVVLPETTEQVQRIMEIAYRHKIPVVPLTTGFNHGGLTIPRKGGILVDLKRMNRLLEIDEESMTATFEPGVRMRSLWFEVQKVETFMGLKLKPILPLTLASISLLSNYVSRGGPGSAVKYGGGPDLTVDMTWVLPNGRILKTGPSSVPHVGNVGVHWGPGPDIGGMFFNADGAFGICTQITVKLYPEMPREEMIHGAIFDEDPKGCEIACTTIYDLAQENLVEFMYKSHPGVMCVTLAGAVDSNPLDLVGMSPRHPLMIIVTGFDDEEVRIRAELVRAILERNGVTEVDPGLFGPAFESMVSTDPLKKSVGVKNNFVGAFRGAFQWQAGYVRVEKVPEINQEYKKLIKKYWKTSDVKATLETALTGTDIQGPLPYARIGTVEFDYWWDQGNPESVKRASVMIRKTTELMFGRGILPIRNMFGFGELLLPRLTVYHEILSEIRHAFDPANLMHPDVLPVTRDYV